MRLRHLILLIGVGLTAARVEAQAVPPPMPPAGQPLPELPPPRPVVPAAPAYHVPPLARQAIESNFYKPVCEPELPTHGVWGNGPCAHHRSWQECIMNGRDCLAWMCTRPNCAQGMRPPSDASLFDWLCDRLSNHSAAVRYDTVSPLRRILDANPRMHP
jgi:hypothetical protein